MAFIDEPDRKVAIMDMWKPSPKIVAAAAAAIFVWVVQVVAGVDVPPGIEGAVAVVIAYLVPSTTVRPIDGHWMDDE